MSNGVFFAKTLSEDGHALMSVNQTPTRSRSSTIGAVPPSVLGSRPDASYGTNGTNDMAKRLGKSANQFISGVRSNPNANEIGARHGQPRRLSILSDHFKGRRNSILMTASDVLGLKLGRPKSSRQESPKPVILPDVIDISAARADAELEERNRLRDMAAQAIGLQPYTDAQDSGHDHSITDDDEDYEKVPSFDSTDVRNATQSEMSSPPNAPDPSSQGSSSSVLVAYSQTPSTSRVRSGSIVGHTAATTTSFAPIPPYPSTVSSLSSFRQCDGLYPKYYPHSSLRIFALSKNWKSRYLMMSSPATFVARGQSPAVSYLHVFKSSGPEEKELERLEINEHSVVFVAEDEVGGKRSVIKVGGADVGAMKKEYIINEGGYSMWLLNIQATVDAQRWITNIKNAILGQRTVRAGLIPAYPLGVHEPHGDMDVMLSIRTQGITSAAMIPKPVRATANVSVTENSTFPSRSVHSLKAAAKSPASPTSLSALKGFFIARPRSAPRPASIDAERDLEKESFLMLSSSLLRSGTPDSSSVPVQRIPTPQMNAAYSAHAEPILDRKILTASPSSPWQSPASTNRDTTAHKSDIILPLQPPPRKRWTANGLTSLNPNFDGHAFTYLGLPNTLQVPKMSMDESEREVSQMDTLHFGSPEHRSRASSLRSVSTFTSGDRRVSIERSSSSTKQSSTRRWSKQSLLPSLMSPPSDPPPPVPVNQVNTPPPTFSKRTSEESSRSATSSGIYSIRRSSMPPPRPAPTSALPPAPIDLDEDDLNRDVLKPLETISLTSKSSLRASSAQRSSRLSLMAPKPPPNSGLPPRPDEPDYNISRRRSSSEYPTTLQSIPGSPLPSATHQDVSLPPTGSLPPLPPPSLPLPVSPAEQSSSTSRVTSLKQRLRMLSTGSVSGPVPAAIGKSRLSMERSSLDLSSSMPSTTFSPPSTPIAERIMPIQDDSFIQLYTPIMTTPPFISGQPSPLDEQDLERTAVTSLSPPPRRGPKQTMEPESVVPTNASFLPSEEQLDKIDHKSHLLASPPLSLGSQKSRLLPEVSETSASAEGWLLPEDSSGTESKLTSFLDSEPGVSSRRSSVISLGFMSV